MVDILNALDYVPVVGSVKNGVETIVCLAEGDYKGAACKGTKAVIGGAMDAMTFGSGSIVSKIMVQGAMKQGGKIVVSKATAQVVAMGVGRAMTNEIMKPDDRAIRIMRSRKSKTVRDYVSTKTSCKTETKSKSEIKSRPRHETESRQKREAESRQRREAESRHRREAKSRYRREAESRRETESSEIESSETESSETESSQTESSETESSETESSETESIETESSETESSETDSRQRREAELRQRREAELKHKRETEKKSKRKQETNSRHKINAKQKLDSDRSHTANDRMTYSDLARLKRERRLFDEESEYKEEEKQPSRRGEHVINNNVLRVFRDIVEEFTTDVMGENLTQMIQDGRLCRNSRVVNAINRPMPEDVMTLIQDILKVRINESYQDRNAASYGRQIQILRGAVVFYMRRIFEHLEYGTDDRGITRSEHAVRDIVYYIITGDYFLDGNILELWLQGRGNDIITFQRAFREVVRMFRRLIYEGGNDEVIEWVKDLLKAKRKRRYRKP